MEPSPKKPNIGSSNLPVVLGLVGPRYSSDIDSVNPFLRSKLQGKIQLVTYEEALQRASTSPINGILTMIHPSITPKLIKSLDPTGSSLKIVANVGVGVDHIDLEGMKKMGVAVTNTPDVLTDTTADMTWALLMACARRIVECNDYCRNGQFRVYKDMILPGSDVHHKTLGVIGMGRIGEAIAKRGTGFDMNILYHNRSRKETAEKTLGAKYVSLEELLREVGKFKIAILIVIVFRIATSILAGLFFLLSFLNRVILLF
eukprot:m.67662 g.67662  ORF g.67662 m.67662 type:complete len:259 (+) comp8224_c0_seq4:99-875(+)